MRSRWVLAAAVLALAASGGPRPLWGAEEFPVPPPPLSEDYFPCMEKCHAEQPPNPKPRELTEHTDIRLHHAEQFRWCLDCHDTQNRDKLHLQSGERIDFTESYRLCGQCHGDKYRDWKKGIHGKRTGSWNGKKEYLLCAHCHNPHSPRFVLKANPDDPDGKDGKPEPAPQVPGSTSLGSHRANARPGAAHAPGTSH